MTVALEALQPEQLLRSLDDLQAPVRLSVTGRQGRANVDLGNGLLMGAEATLPGASGGPLFGLDALRFFLAMDQGEARIAPCRILELANLVRSVEQALATVASAEAPPSEEARVSPLFTPLPPFPELDAEPEEWETGAAPSARPTGARRRQLAGSASRAARRRWTTWALAAACLIAFAVGAIAGLLVEPAPPSGHEPTGQKKVEAAKVLVRVVERMPDARLTVQAYPHLARLPERAS